MTLKLPHRLLQRGYLAYSRVTRGMTLGVRAMLVSGDSLVLVKHSYMPGWYLPGGGVEPGETLGEAVRREAAEEAGARLTGPAQLFGMYRNREADRRDHVGLFVCREWEPLPGGWRRSGEIVGMQLFAFSALPEDATRATRTRIAEVISGEAPSADW
jgi:8-oxo-dGTP pyrophosphatase MutT (NUDIX family)